MARAGAARRAGGGFEPASWDIVARSNPATRRKEESVANDSIDRIRSATFPLARRGYEKREVDRFLDELADWLEGGGGDEARTELVRRDLQRIGQQTAKILTDAHDAGERIKGEAGEEARKVTGAAGADAKRRRDEADRYAAETRAAADDDAKRARAEAEDHSKRVRGEAEAYSMQARTEAEAYAKSTRERADAYAAKVREEVDEAATRIRSRAERDAEQALAKARREADRVVAEGNQRRAGIEKLISDLEEHRDGVVADIDRLSSALAGTVTQHRRVPADGTEGERAAARGAPPPAAARKPRPDQSTPA
jgi:DivIVA domain-containing protein